MEERAIMHVPSDLPHLQFQMVKQVPEMGQVVWVRGYVFGSHGEDRLAVTMPEGMGVYSISLADIAKEKDE